VALDGGLSLGRRDRHGLIAFSLPKIAFAICRAIAHVEAVDPAR